MVTEKTVDFVGFDNVDEFNKIDRMMMRLSKPTKANLVEIHLKRSLLKIYAKLCALKLCAIKLCDLHLCAIILCALLE